MTFSKVPPPPPPVIGCPVTLKHQYQTPSYRKRRGRIYVRNRTRDRLLPPDRCRRCCLYLLETGKKDTSSTQIFGCNSEIHFVDEGPLAPVISTLLKD